MFCGTNTVKWRECVRFAFPKYRSSVNLSFRPENETVFNNSLGPAHGLHQHMLGCSQIVKSRELLLNSSQNIFSYWGRVHQITSELLWTTFWSLNARIAELAKSSLQKHASQQDRGELTSSYCFLTSDWFMNKWLVTMATLYDSIRAVG